MLRFLQAASQHGSLFLLAAFMNFETGCARDEEGKRKEDRVDNNKGIERKSGKARNCFHLHHKTELGHPVKAFFIFLASHHHPNDFLCLYMCVCTLEAFFYLPQAKGSVMLDTGMRRRLAGYVDDGGNHDHRRSSNLEDDDCFIYALSSFPRCFTTEKLRKNVFFIFFPTSSFSPLVYHSTLLLYCYYLCKMKRHTGCRQRQCFFFAFFSPEKRLRR